MYDAEPGYSEEISRGCKEERERETIWNQVNIATMINNGPCQQTNEIGKDWPNAHIIMEQDRDLSLNRFENRMGDFM